MDKHHARRGRSRIVRAVRLAAHVRAERAAVGLRRRRLVHDAALADHDDAVRQLEQLVQVFADQQRRQALRFRLQQGVLNKGGGMDVKPPESVPILLFSCAARMSNSVILRRP